jgi:hypothetical protein
VFGGVAVEFGGEFAGGGFHLLVTAAEVAGGPVELAEAVEDGALDAVLGVGGEADHLLGVELGGGVEEAEDAGVDEVIHIDVDGEVLVDADGDGLDEGEILKDDAVAARGESGVVDVLFGLLDRFLQGRGGHGLEEAGARSGGAGGGFAPGDDESGLSESGHSRHGQFLVFLRVRFGRGVRGGDVGVGSLAGGRLLPECLLQVTCGCQQVALRSATACPFGIGLSQCLLSAHPDLL